MNGSSFLWLQDLDPFSRMVDGGGMSSRQNRKKKIESMPSRIATLALPSLAPLMSHALRNGSLRVHFAIGEVGWMGLRAEYAGSESCIIMYISIVHILCMNITDTLRRRTTVSTSIS